VKLADRPDVLIFVEDPGAANFVTDLPRELCERGYTVHLASYGKATSHLTQRGIASNPLPVGVDVEAFAKQFAPRLLAVGTAENPDSIGLRLIAIARSLGIRSVAMVDASTNLDFRFRGRSANALAFCPDIVMVPDNIGRDHLVRIGLDQGRVVVTGHPHWDHVRSAYRYLRQQGRDDWRRRLFGVSVPERIVVLFAAETSSGLNCRQFQRADDYSLAGDRDSLGRTEIVIEELLIAAAPWRREIHLILRLHPSQAQHDLSAYYRDFDGVSRSGTSLEAVYASDVVVGMTSMLMVEAALMDRPTLAILPRASEAAWLPTIAAGVTPYATSRLEVAQQLEHLLKCRSRPNPSSLDQLCPRGALKCAAAIFERLLREGRSIRPARR